MEPLGLTWFPDFMKDLVVGDVFGVCCRKLLEGRVFFLNFYVVLFVYVSINDLYV